MEFNNFALHWCSVMLDYLLKNNISNFFIGPGSRSTPFIFALAHNDKACKYVAIDERSLGFMALGFSKKNQIPAVIIVTSGTAVANLYPSIVEAYNSCTPLLILTADRPYELLDCSANQTINQNNIFLNHVIKSYNLPPPNKNMPLELSQNIFRQALNYAFVINKGPVHINLQFREALEIIDNNYNLIPKVFTKKTINYDELFEGEGLLVLGQLESSELQKYVLALAQKLNWPIYADILSNLRFIDHPQIIHNFDLCLMNPNFSKLLNMQKVIYIGGSLVSKRFWQWAKNNPQKEFINITSTGKNIDQLGLFQQVLVADLSKFLKNINNNINNNIKYLKNFSQKINKLSDKFLSIKNNNEAFFSVNLLNKINQDSNFFVSSSMPIRYLDQFSKPNKYNITIFANRGASGIDGIISSAIGMALQDKKTSIVLLGDLAFLYDSNGLMLLSSLKIGMLIVVINNQGGGIFNLLPIASDKKVLDVVTTPHKVNIEDLCKAYGIAHVKVFEEKEFDKNIEKYFSLKHNLVIEVMINSNINYKNLKEFYKKVTEAK